MTTVTGPFTHQGPVAPAPKEYFTMGAIQAERDRMVREDDHARFGGLPPFPAKADCPSGLCKNGQVIEFGISKPCDICDGSSHVPGLPQNRADLRRIARSFPRAFRKRVFGRTHRVHRPLRGTTVNV